MKPYVMNDKKIMVIDDDQGILEVIKIVLEEQGYEVETNSNSKTALNQIIKVSPQVLLVDLWMSGLDGSELIKKLKENSQTSKIPIIVMSALNNLEQISKDLGVNDFLPKPFDINDLSSKVKHYLVQLN